MDDGCGSINVDTSFISEILLRNAQCRRLSAHYIQQGLARQVGFVGYIEFVVLNFVTAPSRCQKKLKTLRRPIAVRS
ncbi:MULTISPECIES: hypothetical protein [Pseudomonas syringae group genomosp. 2]|uniref:Uncharacterized protein n=9 Tax=Pseudomonas syringae group TaxID=136849 RepID=A0A3M5ZN24_PSESS|nr:MULTISPECIES: hypothetical protein [Pseudomonas syringae group genomosp. 2]KPW76748.1 hypothetical protein ALO78_102413 [Pseudomonas amygdali pv. ciccaronei]KPX05091.1 hypothetical protein ALO74_102689 [Pseudomonas syringae pv. cunninghamiae]KPX11281.1 hypothetical protein ALO73_102912 [Pseudomonas syringae pv. daphniphylli]KPX19372.1 hypothetical protein ALO70_102662 [Pseudomonas amygdali pv. eriobotryae]KPX32415.1 hypothetical protein ALO69_102958 [Pseudomonas ficuserectae]KPX60885.1 hyp